VSTVVTTEPSITTPGDPSLRHVLGRLDVLRLRVAAVVAARRAVDASPDDPFLGLYLSDDRIDELLRNDRIWVDAAVASDQAAAVERAADAAASAGAELRARTLAARCGLDALDLDILFAAMAPDIDDRFERYYGYLNDDVTRRRVSVGLALGLSGVAATSAAGRQRCEPGGALVASALLEVEELDRPFLTRPLRVPDRVTAHVLGSDVPDATLDLILLPAHPTAEEPDRPLARAIAEPATLVYVRDREAAAAQLAVDAATAAGVPPLVVDLRRLVAPADTERVSAAAMREARLVGGVLVAGPVDELAAANPAALSRLTGLPGRLVLFGHRPWDPGWAGRAPFVVESTGMAAGARGRLWAAALDGHGDSVDPALAVGQYRLGATQIRRAAEAATTIARVSERDVSIDDVRRGARQQNAAGLEHLARRVEAEVTWDDLVLAPPVALALHNLTDRVQHRERVLGEWHMRPGGGRGIGITGLFAGDSGTGKTMSAEVIARALGIDLYIVNLATVVDKYIGETEKNLDRIFAEAADVNGILLFDEADALFGQRSEVRDSHDRYANIEVAYLLQRMESFDGLAVLSTNLRSNIDEAFMRRLDAVIDFPMPDADQRLLLWARCLAPLQLGDDVDLPFVARAFELSGGNIRSVAITIGYRVAGAERAVTMTDVIVAVGEEYRKLGRLTLEAEFGPYHALLRPPT
jgi:hypothetical protein